MQIKENLEIRDIAGETVLIMPGRFGLDMTKVVSFNPTAEWLWRSLCGVTFSLADVVRLLVERYQVDAAAAAADAEKWVAQLYQCNALIE